MKYFYKLLALLFVGTLVFSACSELSEDITPSQSVSVHPEGFGKPGHPNFHSGFMPKITWNIENCQKCHGSNYAGGTAGVGCNDSGCHTQADGPEACNTCHGSFANPDRIAPPEDLEGNTEQTFVGVGAHTAHIYENRRTERMGCFQCHTRPEGEGDFVHAHIDGLPAEVGFDENDKASLRGANPVYDMDNATCMNTYCHGHFEFRLDEAQNNYAYADSVMTGTFANPAWTEELGGCRPCHGMPPTGHKEYEGISCSVCHGAAYTPEGSLDKIRHINGQVDLN